MSNYRSMIDQALEAARARAHSPAETEKSAAAHRPESSLVKEAQEVASALEFISLSASGNDTVAAFRQEMIRDFYKSATASSPAQGPTVASGTQGIAPSEGKTKLAPKGLVGGNAPVQSTPSAAPLDGQKPLLESFKQAEGRSLYDVLMGSKTAGAGGPAEHDSETMAGVSTANENSTYRKTLHTNEGPVNANRRDLKKSTRARLAEAFAHTNDTLGDATAAQIFPQAAARGNLKVASRDMATLGGAALGPFGAALGADEDRRIPSALGALGGGVGGAMLGAIPGAAVGSPQLAVLGSSLGALTGQGAGAYLAHGENLSAKEKLMRLRAQIAAAEEKTAGIAGAAAGAAAKATGAVAKGGKAARRAAGVAPTPGARRARAPKATATPPTTPAAAAPPPAAAAPPPGAPPPAGGAPRTVGERLTDFFTNLGSKAQAAHNAATPVIRQASQNVTDLRNIGTGLGEAAGLARSGFQAVRGAIPGMGAAAPAATGGLLSNLTTGQKVLAGTGAVGGALLLGNQLGNKG